MVSDALEYGRSWPRAATPCNLVPRWAGEFCSYSDWVNFATKRLTGTYDVLTGREVPSICIDAFGRRCTSGAHMMRARDEDAFPVRYFWECEPVAESDAPNPLNCPTNTKASSSVDRGDKSRKDML